MFDLNQKRYLLLLVIIENLFARKLSSMKSSTKNYFSGYVIYENLNFNNCSQQFVRLQPKLS